MVVISNFIIDSSIINSSAINTTPPRHSTPQPPHLVCLPGLDVELHLVGPLRLQLRVQVPALVRHRPPRVELQRHLPLSPTKGLALLTRAKRVRKVSNRFGDGGDPGRRESETRAARLQSDRHAKGLE